MRVKKREREYRKEQKVSISPSVSVTRQTAAGYRKRRDSWLTRFFLHLSFTLLLGDY